MDSTCGRRTTHGGFHMKCYRQISKQDLTRNSEVAARTGLGLVSDLVKRRRNSVFRHSARLSEDTPVHQALRCHVDLTLGHPPEHNRWIDQLRRYNNTSPADLWRIFTRGHTGVTLRSLTTTTTNWIVRRNVDELKQGIS